MSQEAIKPVDQTPETDTEAPVVVKYSEEELTRRLQKTSAEAKSYRQKAAEMQAQLDAIQAEKLEAQGKFQEAAKLAQERAAKAEQKVKEAHGTFALRAIRAEAKAEAAKLGCQNVDDLLMLMDISQVGIDEEFNVDTAGLRAMIENEAKNRAYLFSKSAPKLADLPPKAGAPGAQKSIKEMSAAERMEYLKKRMMGGAR